MEHEHCTQCGFDGETFGAAELLSAIRALGPRWRALLATAGDNLRIRPAPAVWSAMRLRRARPRHHRVHVFGVEQALSEDEPRYAAFEDDLVEDRGSELRHRGPDRRRRRAR